MMKTLPTSEFCNTYDYCGIFDGGRVAKRLEKVLASNKYHYDKSATHPSIPVLNVLVYSE